MRAPQPPLSPARPDASARIHTVLPGQYHVAITDELIATLLGSCVSACIYDPLRAIGGMNHFLLPDPGPYRGEAALISGSTRYGVFAMETLVNALLSRGAARARLRVKLFGGARVLATLSDVGQRNIEFVRRFVATEQLDMVSEDLGGEQPRKLLMYPATGRVLVHRLPSIESQQVAVSDARHLRAMDKPVLGSAELF